MTTHQAIRLLTRSDIACSTLIQRAQVDIHLELTPAHIQHVKKIHTKLELAPSAN